MPPALEFTDISKRYRSAFPRRETWALRNFSAQVDPGEIVGFLGANGAGKTTAIHIALGLTIPSSGSGSLLLRRFGDVQARKRVGFLSESPVFYQYSAARVLAFYGKLNGVPDSKLANRGSEMLEAVGLSEHAGDNISGFSRGMLQRLGLAQALISEPALLILDEPTSALDPVARVRVREILLQLRAKGVAIFLSSHLLSEVELICDRVIFIAEGSTVAEGRTSDFLTDTGETVVVGTGPKPTHAANLTISSSQTRASWSITIASSDQQRVLESIWAAGGTVISMHPKSRSLEDVFLDLLGNGINQQADPQ